ncbi:hypothetical protein [Phytomonospora endophytica]|uniref:Uncharacterized protein n=1 Tax=Phytomonospora endophytica TaxID=714109 RepID=A0A841FGG9_9ACTN|nr:hypothetical protein [Phytomonospora endophytica]MBB6034964.1 hypothetical protein [Phytomonospora endophytica]
MGGVERLWAAGRMPSNEGLYRPDDTALELHVPGPGAYHYDAGQPIPWRIGGPMDVTALTEDGGDAAYADFDVALPDGSGRMTGGSSGMGNIGWIARLNGDGSLRWIAPLWSSNPFTDARIEGTTGYFTNDWRNILTLDLTDPALA